MTIQKKNILFIASSPVIGGAERYFLNIIGNIDKDYFHPVIAGPAGMPLLSEAASLGGETRLLEIGPKLGKATICDILKWPIYFVRIRCFIRKLKREKKVDLIHLQFKKEQFLVSIAAGLEGIPVVWTEHSPILDCFKGKYKILASVYSAIGRRFTSKVIVYSGRSFGDMKKIGFSENKVAMIDVGVNLAGLEKRRVAFFGGYPPVVGCICRLEAYKGISSLIKALPQILLKHSEIKVLIAGEGREMPELKKLVMELSLDDVVVFKGWVAKKDFSDVMDEIDVFVHPSLRGEGTPFSVLEALAAGKVVVASDVGGMRAAVEDNVTGRLVRPADPDGLAKVIVCLLDNPDSAIKMALNGREKAFRCHDVVKMVKATEKVFLDIIEKLE